MQESQKKERKGAQEMAGNPSGSNQTPHICTESSIAMQGATGLNLGEVAAAHFVADYDNL